MQEKSAEATSTGQQDGGGSQNPTKGVRHRKKSYYNAIRRQMEFYFGDANLSKDRFLRQLIESDPYVPLDTFMTFNKMKKLARTVTDIGRALTKSQLVELNEDATRVRRVQAMPENHDADSRTIYVESLPRDADHEWVIRAFARFGPVAYVSLPKYKDSKKIKEFSFVEFESEGAVTKALKAFQSFGGVLCYERAEPEKLVSITSYLKEQEKQEASAADSDDDADSSLSDTPVPPAKRIKLSDTETPTSEMEYAQNDEEPARKPCRRKHRKNRSSKLLVSDLERSDGGPPDISQLKIATKREWKRLRNRYLNLQREKMAEIKRSLRDSARTPFVQPRLPVVVHHRAAAATGAGATTTTTTTTTAHNAMNFYQDRGRRVSSSSSGPGTPIETTAAAGAAAGTTHDPAPVTAGVSVADHFEAGLIIHMRLHEPCTDVKHFKAEMRQYEAVKYVDVKEGAREAHLRCSSATCAQALVQQIGCAEYECRVLQGTAEEEYWNKIMQDRSDKLNKRVKVKSRRGREKIRQQVGQHIRFDEED